MCCALSLGNMIVKISVMVANIGAMRIADGGKRGCCGGMGKFIDKEKVSKKNVDDGGGIFSGLKV